MWPIPRRLVEKWVTLGPRVAHPRSLVEKWVTLRPNVAHPPALGRKVGHPWVIETMALPSALGRKVGHPWAQYGSSTGAWWKSWIAIHSHKKAIISYVGKQ